MQNQTLREEFDRTPKSCHNGSIDSNKEQKIMSDTYTTPFVFHDLPCDLLDIAEHFNFTCDFLDFNITDTGALVFDLTFKSPIDHDLFTRYYNGELGLY